MSRARWSGMIYSAVLAVALPCIAFASSTLYWIDTNYGAPTLNRADLDGVGVTTVALPTGSLPEALAASSTGRVFWTEAAWTNAKIMSAPYSLAGPTALVSGASALRGIAVDDVTNTLYWTASNLATGGAIYRKIGNAAATQLVALPAGSNPRGIAVDRVNGRLLWADAGLDRIYRANLDGSGVQVVQQVAVGARPWGVAVNPQNQWVYWTEYSNTRLARVDYSGANFTDILVGLTNPTYLTRDAATDRLYWTEGAGTQRLRRVNANGTGLTTLPPPLATYGGVAVGPGESSSADEAADTITEVALDRPWPNPAAGSVHLPFALPHESSVHLAVFDVQGRQVALVSDERIPAGRHERIWDGLSRGKPVAAGIYFSRLKIDSRTWVQRLVMTK